MAGTALCEPPCADCVAGAALGEPPCADFVAGAALCEPRSADFGAGAALCALRCWLSLSPSLSLTHTRSLSLTHSLSLSHSHSHSHSHSLSVSHSLTHSLTTTATVTTIPTFITTITSLDPNASRSLDFLLIDLTRGSLAGIIERPHQGLFAKVACGREFRNQKLISCGFQTFCLKHAMTGRQQTRRKHQRSLHFFNICPTFRAIKASQLIQPSPQAAAARLRHEAQEEEAGSMVLGAELHAEQQLMAEPPGVRGR